MRFNFKAKNDEGSLKEGSVEAMSWEAAAQILEKNGLVPISIREEKRASGLMGGFGKWLEGVNQKELVTFFQQLSTLIEARVPIVSALDTIAEQLTNRYFKIIVAEMGDDIEDGMPFSEALERHPDVFSPLTISMVRAGEVSGSLQKSITYVAENIERNYQLMTRIRGALYYPVFVLSVAALVGFLVVTFILPKITVIIKDMKVAVPWYTTMLIAVGDFMSAYWPAVLMTVLAAVGAFIYYIRTDSGKREWEIIVLKLPVIGILARDIYITRFSENLGALLNGGIPVVRALMIASEVVGNQVFAKIILKAADEVRAGGTMSTVLIRHSEIPPIVSQMIRIGEETGTVSKVLGSIAKFYGQEVDNMTKALTSLLEPILIVFLGIGVGIMVVGVLLPIYNIAGQM
jgi:type II secretory pathway component PulF